MLKVRVYEKESLTIKFEGGYPIRLSVNEREKLQISAFNYPIEIDSIVKGELPVKDITIPSLNSITNGGEIADGEWAWLGLPDDDRKKTSKVIMALVSKVKSMSLLAPKNLSATNYSEVRVDLSWSSESTDQEGFKIERSTDNINFTVVGTTDNTSFSDLTVSEYTQYYYRIRAFKGTQYSFYSNLASILTWGWYGIEINEANSSPDVTRIASSMVLHASLPVHSMLRGCLLNDNGVVNYYLNSNDWTKKVDGTISNLDGTDGQVMIEWPDFYYKVESNYPSAGKHQIKISLNSISGFTRVPKHYVSAYQAALNRGNSKMASVKNNTATYRGGDNNSSYDAAYNSRLGMPVSNFTRTNGRTYARNRGNGWNLYGYEDHKWLFWLFVIEYATLNSQKAVNTTLTAEGYKQGGLGNGVTTADGAQWSNNFGYNPFIPCGASDSLANGSGEVSYTIAGWLPSALTVKVPRYRGHENPFGHIWNIVDGVNIEAQSVASGNEHKLWVANNPFDWNDSNYVNYQNRGSLARADGYMSKSLLGNCAEFMPKEVSGASNSYYCDYTYQQIPSSGIVLRMLLVGGAATPGTDAGFVYSHSHYAPSTASANFGSRLRFMAG